MYIPTPMKMANDSEIFEFIEQFSFGTLVSDSLEGSHLPFLLERQAGVSGNLVSHFARANHHCRDLDGQEVLVIFSGPHSYISPTWYAKAPAVPTWNYAAVHVRGRVELLDGPATIEVVEQTVNKYEPGLLEQGDIVTPAIREKLSKAITGFRIHITDIQGKIKLGQHRHPNDQQGVVQGLTESTKLDDKQLLKFMQSTDTGLGNK